MAKIAPEREAATGSVAMPRWASAVITVVSFPAGPGIVMVLVPWLITRWHSGVPPYPLAATRAAAVPARVPP
jgi:hypothetical protein